MRNLSCFSSHTHPLLLLFKMPCLCKYYSLLKQVVYRLWQTKLVLHDFLSFLLQFLVINTLFHLFSFALFSIYLTVTFPPNGPPELPNAHQYFSQLLKYLEKVTKNLPFPFCCVSLFPSTLYHPVSTQNGYLCSLGLGHNSCPITSFHHSVLDLSFLDSHLSRFTPSL